MRFITETDNREALHKERLAATDRIDALTKQLAEAVEALEEIRNLCPATCDMTTAHVMADTATATLARIKDRTNG